MWPQYAKGDERNPELSFPPNGFVMPWAQAVEELKATTSYAGPEPFVAQAAASRRRSTRSPDTLQDAEPDITIIISDDQDEWFYEHNMPRFAVYWGDSVPLIPRAVAPDAPEMARRIAHGYGDVPMEVPVASRFGRYLVEYLCDHDFDPRTSPTCSSRTAARSRAAIPTPDGELNSVRETKISDARACRTASRLSSSACSTTSRGRSCPSSRTRATRPTRRPPSARISSARPSATRCRAWDEPARVAVVASGGLSHFVVDEEQDRKLLSALEDKDAADAASAAEGAAVLGHVRVAELDRRRRRDGEGVAEVRPGRLRARVSHARQHRRRLGVRSLAVRRLAC